MDFFACIGDNKIIGNGKNYTFSGSNMSNRVILSLVKRIPLEYEKKYDDG